MMTKTLNCNQKIEEFKDRLDSSSYYKCLCVICGGDAFDVIANVDRYGFDYKPGICRACGSVQQTEYYTDDVLSDFYANYYSRIYRDGLSIEDSFKRQRRKGAELHDFCVQHVPSNCDVLDIGCSCGGILSIFQERGHVCQGTDYDVKYLEFGRSKGLLLSEGGLPGLEPGSKFDLIILRHVLEHITDPDNFLSDIKPFLKKDGKLYVEVPSIEYVSEGGYDFDMSNYFQNAHFMHFTTKSFEQLARKNGFKLVKSNRYIKALLALDATWNKHDVNSVSFYNYSVALLNRVRHRQKGYYKVFFDNKIKLKKFLKRFLK